MRHLQEILSDSQYYPPMLYSLTAYALLSLFSASTIPQIDLDVWTIYSALTFYHLIYIKYIIKCLQHLKVFHDNCTPNPESEK